MVEKYKYMVVTRCFTYNHAPYIVDAMNGFTMQETNFPVITCIVDDASTDGESEVIRQYITDNFQKPYRIGETDDYCLICADHKTNVNCTFVVFLLKYNHYSIKKPKSLYLSEWWDNAKYIALCEGDDYWIDNRKLEKQVGVLERNSNVSMVYTLYRTVNDKKEEISLEKHQRYKKFSREGDIFSRLLWENHILTLTTCYRKKVFETDAYLKAPFKYDYNLFLSSSLIGNIALLKETTGCYRITSTGATATQTNVLGKATSILAEYYANAYLDGTERMKRNFFRDFIIRIVMITKVINQRKALFHLLRRSKFNIVVFPIAFGIKVIESIGMHIDNNFNRFKLYQVFVFDV